MVLLSVRTDAGVHYVLEYTGSLPATGWTAWTTVLGDGTVKTLTDSGAPNHQRFYRARVQ